MARDGKRGLFSSLFAPKKRKSEEELEAERELHQKLENRIREVLVVTETPQFEPIQVAERTTESESKTEVELFPILAPAPSEPAEETEYTYLHPHSTPDFLRKPPSRYRPAARRFAAGRSH